MKGRRAINPENIIKARTSETIVEEIFRSAGYHVFRFAYKPLLQNIVITNKIDYKLSIVLSRMPDLLVATENNHFFVEVKYRKDGKLSPNEVRTWDEAVILLVFPFPPYFRIGVVSQFIKTKTLVNLAQNEVIPVERKIIEPYIPLVQTYFGKTNNETITLGEYSEEKN